MQFGDDFGFDRDLMLICKACGAVIHLKMGKANKRRKQ